MSRTMTSAVWGRLCSLVARKQGAVLGKSSLIFKAPLDGEYPEGTIVPSLRDNEFLQLDGENVYVYARNADGESHLVCGVDLTYRATPEWAEERDDVQDQVYSDDLDQRVQRAVDARLAAPRPVVSGGGGPMVPHGQRLMPMNGRALVASDKSTSPSVTILWKEGGRRSNSGARSRHSTDQSQAGRGRHSLTPSTTTSAEGWIPQVQLHGISCSVKWNRIP